MHCIHQTWLHLTFSILHLKKWLPGKKILWNAEIVEVVNEYFERFDSSYCLDGLRGLEKHPTNVELGLCREIYIFPSKKLPTLAVLFCKHSNSPS